MRSYGYSIAMPRSNSDRTYSVGEVAEAFGVTPATVRNWDGSSLRSFRTPGNQRRFKLSENPKLAALLSPTPDREQAS